MDVKTFVAEALHQIVAGISEAQGREQGDLINAIIPGAGPGPYGNLINAGRGIMFTRVEFDIAVSAETLGGGRGSLQVLGVGGVSGGAEHKTGYANRISFSVPVKLPMGKSEEQTKP
jgi:hypothetical protein